MCPALFLGSGIETGFLRSVSMSSFLSDPISFLANWLQGLLLGWGLAPGVVDTLIAALGVVLICIFGLSLTILLIWAERKIGARFQGRLGPNRLGPFGLFQTIADVIKIFTKEHITPKGVDTLIFNLAPLLSVSAVLLLWAVIPFASTVIGTQINVGVLYIVAVGSLGTLAILIAGWSSNNKYALLGAFRTVAQMVSYEVPMVLSLLVVTLLARSMSVAEIVEQQNVWFILVSPLAFLMFLISSQAETGRAPFDLMEAESELVAGYQTEYSGLKFGMFFVGEFLHAFTVGALIATFFLGGWRGPWAEQYPILGIFYFFIKAFLMYFVTLWLRFSLPRIRIDHMSDFNWKFLVPLGLILVMMIAIVDKVIYTLSPDPNLWLRAGIHLVFNILLLVLANVVMQSRTRRRPSRIPVGQPRPVARPVETASASENA
jgi:NADH-quinone oxidoreductase subunit H